MPTSIAARECGRSISAVGRFARCCRGLHGRLDLKRGDIVTVAAQGDYGKPRPALIVQADVFNDIHASITVVPLTGTIINAPLFRITLDPSRQNGLSRVSQIMVDTVLTLPREKIGKRGRAPGRYPHDSSRTRCLSGWECPNRLRDRSDYAGRYAPRGDVTSECFHSVVQK
jgi:mRNA interferase MazF